MRVTRTPWAARALESDPVEAMTVEAMTRPLEGTLHLYAKSSRGPFKAIYHAPGDDTFNGSRGEGRTVRDAVAKAIGA